MVIGCCHGDSIWHDGLYYVAQLDTWWFNMTWLFILCCTIRQFVYTLHGVVWMCEVYIRATL